MTDSTIRIKVEGLDKIVNSLDRVGDDFNTYMKGAGIESANAILDVRGLRKYPPATGANQPPPPFYIRGRGMQTSAGRNNGRSERLGTRWEILYRGANTEIRNPVTYARWVHGDGQARPMANIGWRKLTEVAVEKISVITSVYDRWVTKLLRKSGLE